MNKQELILSLKKEIVDGLRLEDVKPGDIDENLPLFGDAGLGLDSLDAVELAFIVEKNYGVAVGDAETARVAFSSVNDLAAFILSRKENS